MARAKDRRQPDVAIAPNGKSNGRDASADSGKSPAELAFEIGGHAFERYNICARSTIKLPHKLMYGKFNHYHTVVVSHRQAAICCACRRTSDECTVRDERTVLQKEVRAILYQPVADSDESEEEDVATKTAKGKSKTAKPKKSAAAKPKAAKKTAAKKKTASKTAGASKPKGVAIEDIKSFYVSSGKDVAATAKKFGIQERQIRWRLAQAGVTVA